MIGKDHIGSESVALVLGDNLFYGPGLGSQLADSATSTAGQSSLTGSPIPLHPASSNSMIAARDLSLEEKPNLRDPTMPFPACTSMATTSWRWLPRWRRQPAVSTRSPMSTAATWMPAGFGSRSWRAGRPGWTPGRSTPSARRAILSAPCEKRQGLSIGVPEEAAWRRGFIGDDDLRERGELLFKSGYGAYLLGLLDGWGAEL